MEITKASLNDLAYRFKGAAIEVHKSLGPGLLEIVYHQCLKHELKLRNIAFVSEKEIPVNYKGIDALTGLRCDFVIENSLVIELKSVVEIIPVHGAQLLTYMKLIKVPRGILLNFNVSNLFNEGHKTFVNEYYTNLKEK